MPLVPDGNLVCTSCRWRGAHSPNCGRAGDGWPMMDAPDIPLSEQIAVMKGYVRLAEYWRDMYEKFPNSEAYVEGDAKVKATRAVLNALTRQLEAGDA
jgi:hypothetical protein